MEEILLACLLNPQGCIHFSFTIFFTKPDNIFTSKTEWLVFPESTALNNQYFVNTSCSVEESCGSTFCIHTIENKEERIVLVQSATLHMVVCL